MRAPILTVTLNPAVDKTYIVRDFCLDRVHRPSETHVTAGGKGINVARVYRRLGGEATATGFLGGNNGDYIQRQLALESINDGFVHVAGESRVCLAIKDLQSETLTELNENGPDVTSDDCAALVGRLRELLPGQAAVILSGSVPPGTPVTLYRDIIRLAQEEFGVPAVLDTSGESLEKGIMACPFLVKPNLAELEAFNMTFDDSVRSAQALREFYSVENALVTMGAQGAVLASPLGIWQAVPPSVNVSSAVGSGDALAAGFLWAWLHGNSWEDALRLGVAAGTANALSLSAGFLDPQTVFHLAGQTQVSRLA